MSIPDSVSNIGANAFERCTNLTSVTIGNGLTLISYDAFFACSNLTRATIGSSVTNIESDAFGACSNLNGIYFKGNAPVASSIAFLEDSNAIVYYVPGTIGWGLMLGGRPTALWVLPNPTILNNNPSFGVQSNGFGFIISWATNISVMVEVSTNLANSSWLPVSTNALSNGVAYFSDPQWTNFPARFYRIRSP